MADPTDDAPEPEAGPERTVERAWRPAPTARPLPAPDADDASAGASPAEGSVADPADPEARAPTDAAEASLDPDAPPFDRSATDPDAAEADGTPPDADADALSPGGSGASPSAAEEAPDGPRPSADADGPADAGESADAQNEPTRINDEAFADAAGPTDWTDQVSQPPPPTPASPPDADTEFVTDETRRDSPADRVEEAIQDAAYRQNEGDVGSDWTPRERKAHKIATTFALLVSKVAEDMSYQRRPGDEFWDPRKIMRRQIDNRPLRHCKMEYTKRRLALLVDTSPSCRDEAVFYSKIASGALLRDDIDIFLCPNGRIDAKFDPEPMRFVTDERGEDWGLEGRTVLYFTDWDGREQLVRHARHCTLYWFDNCDPERYWESREDRYRRVRLRYRGHHFHCPDPDTFQRLVRKIRP